MESRVLEEFMPRTSTTYDDEHQNICSQIDKDKKMSDWLRSASLWNPSSDLSVQKSQVSPTPLPAKHVDDGTAWSLSLEREKTAGRISLSSDVVASASPPTQSAATTDAAGGGADSGKSAEKQERQIKHKKQRRNWSPELHRLFLQALKQLGGSHGG